ncbi:MAG: hypothetical protein IPJ65_15590 [Archangiaceae bacterium]|nr:hypothetical protein [Archangiaceae bacterium]
MFGDKDGLLEAVAEDQLARYIARKKAHPPRAKPLDDLRLGWDLNVEFNLQHPAVFAILSSDTRPASLARVAAGGIDVLRARIRAVAAAGLFRDAFLKGYQNPDDFLCPAGEQRADLLAGLPVFTAE